MAGDQINIGIFGAGLIGRAHSLMIRLIADRSANSVRVAAVYDVAQSAAEQLAALWDGARAARSVEEILADKSIDAVFICTPTAAHRAVCIAAARAGKHIFCEKPLAMSAAEAAEMQAEVERAGVTSQVGLVLRFSPVYTVIRALATEPEAGRMLGVTMRDDQDFPIRGAHPSAWRNDPAQSAGGTLVEHSVHDLDLMGWMFGPITRIYCRTRVLNGRLGIEDSAFTSLEFAGGFHGQLTSIWHHVLNRPSNRRLEVFTENLFLACDHDINGPIAIQRAEGMEERITEDEVMRRFGGILLRERPYLSSVRELFPVAYALEDAAFLAAIRGETRADPDLSEGVRAQRTVEMAYQSARLGAPVEIAF